MKAKHIYKILFISVVLTVLSTTWSYGQFLLQAPNDSDQHNYRWYEASDRNTVLGTEFYYEVTSPGIYFATYDGTICGSNATGYFIVTDCNSPNNEVTLDISQSVNTGATVSWSPAVSGDQLRPQVLATTSVQRYTATITKAGNSSSLPNFTVVCMYESSNLTDDMFALNEDASSAIPVFDNDSDIPDDGALTTSNPSNGTVDINNNGTPNIPGDDSITYTPNPDFNGTDSFTYTICNPMGDCSTATVSIDVLPIVDALDDTVAAIEEEATSIYILANDNDIPTDAVLTVSNPTSGSITINDNGTPTDTTDDYIVYTGNPDFVGNDSFTYTLCDADNNCSTATIIVMVNPAAVTNLDADGDGIVDSFEDLNLDGDNDASTNPTDSDGDGVPDYLDIDSDNDGIPDNVEAQYTSDYIPPSGVDENGNGLDDAYEANGVTGIFPIDSDGDSLPDYLDEDADNDNVPDYIEAHDYDHDGVPDVVLLGSDKDNDGLDDGFEGSLTIDIDVNDEFDDPYNDLPNTDSDDEPDYRDYDDDDDGIFTQDEDTNGDGNYANDDTNANGIPDYLDPDLGATTITVDVINVITPDGDGVHDVLEIRGIENFPNNTVKIFNRWGVMVYSTQSYNTQGNVFDGTSEGRVTVEQDKKLPVGTYFYILDYEDETGAMHTDSGYLYINR